jgi:hypothetical protein
MISRNQRLNALLQSSNMQQFQHISITDDKTEIYASDKNKIYIPTPTAMRAHADDALVRVMFGPYGSGKTTWAINDIVRRTCDMPFWTSTGRRRARWAIVRNTSGELHSTTLQSWLMWFGELGDIRKHQKPILTYEHLFNDGNGMVELELIFLALDREDDLRKVKSMELTGAYLNELSEIPQGALSHLKTRVGRYPSQADCPEYYHASIIADTNPPDEDHWIHKQFEEQNIPGYKIFHQPPGLIKDKDGNWMTNPDADNIHNLKDKNYYVTNASGQTEQFIKVFCLGEYGSVGFNKLVYAGDYNDDTHSVDELEAIQGEPIHLGFDFGLTPACVVVQISEHGQLRVLKEYVGDDIGIKTFAESVVLPRLARDFPYCKIGLSRADPSGIKSDEIMEELSCIGTLNTIGIDTNGASTNHIDPRLGAVRYFLNSMADRRPRFILSRKGAPTIRKGFTKDYYYKRISVAGEERYRDIPNKNYASHPHDALQYIAMEFAAQRIIEEKSPKEKVDMFNPTFRWLN